MLRNDLGVFKFFTFAHVIFWGVDHPLGSSVCTVCPVFDYDYYYDYIVSRDLQYADIRPA